MQATQLELLPVEDVQKQETIEETFELFHEYNPHVYEVMREYALIAKRRGVKIGMRLIFERVRWDYMIHTSGQTFKINNNYAPYYARLLMEQEHELEGFFETRAMRSERPHD